MSAEGTRRRLHALTAHTRVFKQQGDTSSARWYAHPDGTVYHSRAVGHVQVSRYALCDLLDKAEFEEIEP